MLSAYFFNDGKILVPSDVWEMGTEVRGLCKGSCRGIANMGAADASRRFAY